MTRDTLVEVAWVTDEVVVRGAQEEGTEGSQRQRQGARFSAQWDVKGA